MNWLQIIVNLTGIGIGRCTSGTVTSLKVIDYEFWHPFPNLKHIKLSLSEELCLAGYHILSHMSAGTHTGKKHTPEARSKKKSVTMAEFSNWLWTAASANALVLSESCQWLDLLLSFSSAGQSNVKHLGQDIIQEPSPFALHLLQWFQQLLLLQPVILLSVLRQQKWERVTIRARQHWVRKKSDRHWHSKTLINTNCLSNNNISVVRAFYVKSNDAASAEVMHNGGVFLFASNLYSEQTVPLPDFQLISKQLL